MTLFMVYGISITFLFFWTIMNLNNIDTKRIGEAGYCPPFGLFIDAAGSKDWLEEIPESMNNSSIRSRTIRI